MTDTYQAIYDGVRSRISNGDIGSAVRDVAFQHFDISWLKEHAQQAVYQVANEWSRPSVLFKPEVFPDGTAWCALLGENLQEGIAGFGDTPAEALTAFDQAFWNGRTPAAIRAAQGIEAQRATTTEIGVVGDESPVAESDAPESPSDA